MLIAGLALTSEDGAQAVGALRKGNASMNYEQARQYLNELRRLIDQGPGPNPEALERFDQIRRQLVWDEACSVELGSAFSGVAVAFKAWFGKTKPGAPIDGARGVLQSHLGALDRMSRKDFPAATPFPSVGPSSSASIASPASDAGDLARAPSTATDSRLPSNAER